MNHESALDEAQQKAVASIGEGAKTEFNRSKGWFLGTLAAVPPDRLTWTPHESARNAIQLAAHTALCVGHMLGNLKGNTFTVPFAEADVYHREQEAPIDSVERINEVFDENTRSYFEWLDLLTIDDLRSSVLMPFEMGSISLPEAIGFMSKHVDWHHAQLQYLQTIYGDREWY